MLNKVINLQEKVDFDTEKTDKTLESTAGL